MKAIIHISVVLLFGINESVSQPVMEHVLPWGSVKIQSTRGSVKVDIQIERPTGVVLETSHFIQSKVNSDVLAPNAAPAYTIFYAVPPGTVLQVANIVPKYRTINLSQDQVISGFFKTSDTSFIQPIYKLVDELSDLITEEPVRIDGYIWFRGYRLACIRIAPYVKQGGSIVAIESIQADFQVPYSHESTISQQAAKDLHFDEVLKNIILNYDEAKSFARSMLNWSDTTGNWFFPGMSAVKLAIPQDEIYKLTYDDLQSAGAPVEQIDPTTFRLLNRGKETPIFIQGDSDHVFSPGDYIEFVGKRNYGLKDYRAIATGTEEYREYLNRYTDTSVYWLIWGGANGLRMSTNSEISFVEDTLDWYTEVVHLEKNSFLQFIGNSDVVNQDPRWLPSDMWGWGWLNGGGTFNADFSASDISNNYPTANIYARFASWGGMPSAPPPTHRVRLRLNSSDTLQWLDLQLYQQALMQATASTTELINGDNTIFLHSLPTASIPVNALLIDWFDVEYPRTLTTPDSLIFAFRMVDSTKIRGVRITGLTTTNVSLYKMSPVPKRITDTAFIGASPFTLVFYDTVAPGDTYVLLSTEKIKTPLIWGVKELGDLRNSDRQVDYLVITQKRFWNTVQSYMSYIGSKYNLTTAAIDVDDIFDQFGYGYPAAESIREFIKSTAQWRAPLPAYILIVGDAVYDSKYILADPNPVNRPFNAVPSIGHPVSDPYLAVIEDADTIALPQMYVGRVPVNTDADFQVYFARVQKYLSEKNDDWNKRYIFFAGGLNPIEVSQFKAVHDYIISTNVEPNPVAGIAANFYKTTDPQSDYGPYSADYVRDVIDNGGVYISYIGHSGTQTWDNGIGDPIQLQNNRGKYALITDFGCSTAKFAESNINCFGELFLLSSTGSAIAYIGNSALGFQNAAVSLPKLLFKRFLQDSILQIGKAHYLAKVDHINSSGGFSSPYNRVMMYTNTLLGDPAIELAIPLKPNLSVRDNDISTNPSPVSDDDTFADIFIPYQNTGSVTADTVGTVFSLSYFGVTSDTILQHSVPRFQDTLRVRIPIEQRSGDIQLSVQLNSGQQISEIDYSDNSAVSQFTVLSGVFRQVSPIPYFEQSVTDLKLLNPTIKPQDGSMEVELEIDTVGNFQYPRQFTEPLGLVITKFSLLSLEAGKRYYWRAGLKNSAKPRTEGTFIISHLNRTRWRQADSISWSNSELTDAEYLQGFGVTTKEKDIILRLTSSGANDGGFGAVEINGFNILPNTYARGHSIVILDTITITAKEIRQFDNSNSSSSAWSDSLTAYIGRISPGETVLDVVIFDGSLNFTQSARDALKSIGASSYIDSLGNRDSYAIIGRKGALSGSVKEVYKQTFTGKAIIDTLFMRKPQDALVVSPQIGPVKSWDSVEIKRSIPAGAGMLTSIIGILANGATDTLVASSTDSVFSLTNVPAKTYAKIQLAAQLSANNALESPLISEWSVTAEPPPELAINYQAVMVSADSILEGNSVSITVDVYNVGNQPVESIYVALKEIRRDIPLDTLFIPLISQDTSQRVTFLYSTIGRRGDNLLYIEVDPKQSIQELYKTNNTYTFPVYVRTDIVPPSIDVTFDGQHIFSGDYVLPDPTIQIVIYDNSPLQIIRDSVYIIIDGQIRTPITDPNILVELRSGPEKAIVTYKPQLKGRKDPYTLMVEVQDSSNNKVALQAPLSFFIDSLWNIRNVFNYPNPFASDTYFTFTLTDYADNLDIKIYTISGRLIHDIKIAPQSNAYYRVYWDGRDYDGDEVANGVYFYKIIANCNGSTKEAIQKLAKIR